MLQLIHGRHCIFQPLHFPVTLITNSKARHYARRDPLRALLGRAFYSALMVERVTHLRQGLFECMEELHNGSSPNKWSGAKAQSVFAERITIATFTTTSAASRKNASYKHQLEWPLGLAVDAAGTSVVSDRD
jgi:hypothetical protein